MWFRYALERSGGLTPVGATADVEYSNRVCVCVVTVQLCSPEGSADSGFGAGRDILGIVVYLAVSCDEGLSK